MADINPMASLTAIAIGTLILIAVFMFIPYVGGTIEGSMPSLAADSDWNETHNEDLPNGADTWTTIASLLTLAAVVLVISIVILYFKGML